MQETPGARSNYKKLSRRDLVRRTTYCPPQLRESGLAAQRIHLRIDIDDIQRDRVFIDCAFQFAKSVVAPPQRFHQQRHIVRVYVLAVPDDLALRASRCRPFRARHVASRAASQGTSGFTIRAK
jgi:hypothetical protein